MRLIPSIDLRGGFSVRLLRGDFGAETRYEEAPLEVAARYRAMGVRVLHVVDLDGARDGRVANRATVRALAQQPGLALQVGGGVRDASVVDDLLSLGVARVVVGSAAVERPDEVASWLSRWGAAKVVLALDVRADEQGMPRVHTRGWTAATQLSLWDALRPFAEVGAAASSTGLTVLCTDIACDGALTGPNLALYTEAVQRFPQVRWQASGGVRSAADLGALAALGVDAAISGKAMLEHKISREELSPFLPNE
jgi:phosphoribosylformimino-5-aminoimidazole carboxamide ribotide isomerase